MLLIPASLWCQNAKEYANKVSLDNPSLHVGPIIMGGGSMMLFVPSVSQKPHLLFGLGASSQLENGKYTGLDVSVFYTVRGWTEKFPPSKDIATNKQSFQCDLHYIEMPVLASIHYPLKNIRLGIKLGPQIGILLHSKKVIKGNNFSDIQKYRQDIPITGRFAWGLTAGPSVTYNFGKNRIELEARFYMGFNDLISTTMADKYSKASELSANITLSYLFKVL